MQERYRKEKIPFKIEKKENGEKSGDYLMEPVLNNTEESPFIVHSNNESENLILKWTCRRY